VASYVDILYRISRFASGLPPNVETYLLAVVERPEALVGAAVWVAYALAGDLFISVFKLVLMRCAWSLLPIRIRRSLTRVVGYFLPGSVLRDPARECATETTERVAGIEARLRELEKRLDDRDGPDDGGGGEER